MLLISGVAALGWQFVWTQQLGIYLGHEAISVLAVMGAFFGGSSLGAFALSHRLECNRWPGRWFVACELVIGLWGLVLSVGLPHLLPVAVGLLGQEPSPLRHLALAFSVPFIALLPATLAMGITLPAIERLLHHQTPSNLGGLYAANTFGALLGVALVVWTLVPALGLKNTGLVFSALNLLCAGIAWLFWGQRSLSQREPGNIEPVHDQVKALTTHLADADAWPPMLLLGVTGLLGIGYEVLVIRVLSQVTENTVFSYALLLAVYLVGTALGAAFYQKKLRNNADSRALLQCLLFALVATIWLSGLGLWHADRAGRWMQSLFGTGMTPALAGEMLAAIMSMALPTFVMGALFTHLCLTARGAKLSAKAPISGHTIARALSINTAGAALAPYLIGVILLPWLGAKTGWWLIMLAYLLLLSPRFWRMKSFYALVLAVSATALLVPPLQFFDVPEGGRVLSHTDGVMAAVSVIEDGEGIAHLHINNRVQEGSSAASPVESRLALIPMMMHPAPHTALFLGLGTGHTACVAATERALEVTAVELLPEVVAATHFFTPPEQVAAAKKVRVVVADARRFVQSGHEPYDLIVADLFHPARNGAGSLYTREHFDSIHARLAPGGLYCQWLALHQMDLDTLRSVIAAYLQVFPKAVAVLASNSLDSPVIGLISRRGGERFNADEVQSRIEQFGGTELLRTARLGNRFAVLGSVVADADALRRFTAVQLPNSDDRPLVIHLAPRTTYAPETTPRQRLATFVNLTGVKPENVVSTASASDTARFAAYWQARDQYLQLGMSIRPSGDPSKMLDQLQAPLSAILRGSPDFQPAWEPLLAMSQAIAATDPARRDKIIATLRNLDPQPPELAVEVGRPAL